MSYLDLFDQPDHPYLRFVLKLHQATTLHYDFRLELDGVLRSWVLYKEPSFDPRSKVPAIPVNDHDPRYLLSERRIPKGRYGAGPMLIADHGTYCAQPCRDGRHEEQVREQLERGRLLFPMYGIRHKGLWSLNQVGKNWFLQKHDDQFASPTPPAWDRRSVLTGRSLDEI